VRLGAGVAVCLEQGASDLYMVQLMALPHNHENVQWFTFLVPT